MKSIYTLILLFLTIALTAQELPPIKVYAPKVYGAENQNWAVAQSKNKHIYVANNHGLLEFNGEKWKLYTSPNGKMRSVKVFNDKIYTGCYRDFGFWEYNQKGILIYTSLSEKCKIDFLEDEEFWNIIQIEDYILFQSLNRIYLYNSKDKTCSTITSDTIIHQMFKVENDIYYQKIKGGIYKIEKGKSKLISDAAIFKNNYIVNIFTMDNQLLIQTENKGFYRLNSNKPSFWNIQANKTLFEVSVYRSLQLKNGSFILGTRSNGIIHLTQQGDINYTINLSKGLSNNSIHSIFEDVDSNIWLALESGINCVNVNSALSIYKDREGKTGSVYASIVHNNQLYLGTNQGLFCKSIDTKNDFTFIPGTEGPVRCLKVFDSTLFCGHHLGTFVIKNQRIAYKIDVNGTWDIKPIDTLKNTLLQGNYDGLSMIEKKENIWQLRNKIKGFQISSRFFETFDHHKVFVNHEYKGVYKLTLDQDYLKVLQVTKEPSIEKGYNSGLTKFNNKILYAYEKGILSYNATHNTFQQNSLFNQLYTSKYYTSGKLIWDEKHNKLWNFSKENVSYVSISQMSDIPKVYKIPLSKALPRGLTGYENISHLYDQKYLIGTYNGYVILDISKIIDKPHKINVNTIILSDAKGGNKTVNIEDQGKFKNTENNLAFNYHVTNYNKYFTTNYQYLLEGLGNTSQWSTWTTTPRIRFNNLPHGTYTFKVRSKVGNTISQNIATYKFHIEKPWYISTVMIIVYIIIVLLFSIFMHYVYKLHYKRQQNKAMEKTMRDLELKELENKQQRMRFNNEQLKQDIESKNRELAISTMSIIKKNEFLGTLKKELQNIDNITSLKNVIKIIDRNLNNSDDWNLFQEAFNNADKDFLKKIKSLHPSLTSNDLKLCAYLRLNLSSKEIAPLLNISPRSVEVKRYRLRKKLELSHKNSLTDYILEI